MNIYMITRASEYGIKHTTISGPTFFEAVRNKIQKDPEYFGNEYNTFHTGIYWDNLKQQYIATTEYLNATTFKTIFWLFDNPSCSKGYEAYSICDITNPHEIKQLKEWNHYKWLDQNFWKFLDNLGVSKKTQSWNAGIITAHGDKPRGYRGYNRIWYKNNIPFEHGTALYLLTHMNPWAKEVRNTQFGFIEPHDWVINNYNKYKQHLPIIGDYSDEF